MRQSLRALGDSLRRFRLVFETLFDGQYLEPNTPLASKYAHDRWLKQLAEQFNKPGLKILELGSREVTGASRARKIFSRADYTGFDIYAGDNVDIVGDAHRASSYFADGEQFDLIFSSACFEHFAMPWVVAQEIAKLLRVGGHVFVETHFSFSSHERPWHFFQFSDMALRVLFSPALGFECIEAGLSNPMVGRFSKHAAPYLRNRKVGGLYCHSEFFGKKIRECESFRWEQVELDAVVAGTCYPQAR